MTPFMMLESCWSFYVRCTMAPILRQESVKNHLMLNPVLTAAVRPSGMKLSSTVTFLIQKPSKNFLNQGHGSFTLRGLE